MMEYVESAWSVLLELSPWLLLGAVISGVLHVILPRDFLSRHLRGPGGVFRAVLFGVPLPLCSCGVIPAGIGLKRDGASDGASMGFLIATPQTGVDSLFVTASLLGWPFAVFKLVSASITGVVGGLLVEQTTRASPPPINHHVNTGEPSRERSPDLWAGLEHGLDVLRSIWRWLVFGVLVSAGLTVLVPVGSFGDASNLGAWGLVGVTLAISIPLYVCAVASVPIAAALVASGFPPSAALIFLIAGPATNVATIGAIGRTFGYRNLFIYLTTILVGSVLFGQLLDLTWAAEVGCTHCHSADGTPTQLWSATVLVGLILFFAIEDLRPIAGRLFATKMAEDAREVRFIVGGLTCNGCARKLQTALSGLEGVQECTVTKTPDVATLRTTQSMQVIEATVTSVGFSIESYDV